MRSTTLIAIILVWLSVTLQVIAASTMSTFSPRDVSRPFEFFLTLSSTTIGFSQIFVLTATSTSTSTFTSTSTSISPDLALSVSAFIDLISSALSTPTDSPIHDTIEYSVPDTLHTSDSAATIDSPAFEATALALPLEDDLSMHPPTNLPTDSFADVDQIRARSLQPSPATTLAPLQSGSSRNSAAAPSIAPSTDFKQTTTDASDTLAIMVPSSVHNRPSVEMNSASLPTVPTNSSQTSTSSISTEEAMKNTLPSPIYKHDHIEAQVQGENIVTFASYQIFPFIMKYLKKQTTTSWSPTFQSFALHIMQSFILWWAAPLFKWMGVRAARGIKKGWQWTGLGQRLRTWFFGTTPAAVMWSAGGLNITVQAQDNVPRAGQVDTAPGALWESSPCIQSGSSQRGELGSSKMD